MTALGALGGSASILLLAAAVGKVRSPAPVLRFLRSLGAGVPAVVVRVGAGVEALIALSALLTGAAWATALVGVCYLSFAAAIWLGLRSGTPAASCGCFGGGERPPSWTHLVIDLAFAGVALGAAASTRAGLMHAVATGSAAQALLVAMALLTAWLGYLAIVSLPVIPTVAGHHPHRPVFSIERRRT